MRMVSPRAVRDVPDCPKDGTVPGMILVGCMVVAAEAKGLEHSRTFDVYGPSNLHD